MISVNWTEVPPIDERFYIEQFEIRALTPAVWALSARRLKRCADIIFSRYEDDLRAMESGTSPLECENLELSGCATLLYGLTLESMLKAIVIQVHPDTIAGGRLRKWPADGHDLIQLCTEAQVQVNQTERGLLERLTAFVRWAGRYPVPKSGPQMRLAQAAVQPDFLPLPLNSCERSRFDTLYARLELLVISPD